MVRKKQGPARRHRRSPLVAWSRACEAHDQGRFDDARRDCAQVLKRDPRHADAWQLLGTLHYREGRVEEGLSCLQRALSLAGPQPELLSNLGALLISLSRFAEARAHLEESIAREPCQPAARLNLAIALMELGELSEAESTLERVARLAPDLPDLRTTQGNLWQRQGRWDEALAAHRDAVAHAPSVAARINLAEALRHLGAYDEAEEILEQVLRDAPQALPARLNLARVWSQSRVASNRNRAEHTLRALAAEYPDSAVVLRSLADHFLTHGEPEESLAWLERVGAATTDAWMTATKKAECFTKLGQSSQALEILRSVVTQHPQQPEPQSQLLYALSAHPDTTEAELLRNHQEWGRRFASPTPLGPFDDWDWSPQRPLRLGFVSPDFRQHAVSAYLEPVLETLDRSVFHIACFSNVTQPDEVTTRLQGLSHHWSAVQGMTDRQLASHVREAKIDILFDLAGHTLGNRLPAFGYRPAPVQCSWLGYPHTTGVPTMDYYLTNAILDPPGQSHHVETLWRMEHDTCFRPPPSAPHVNPLPAGERGRITLGSFQRFSKIGSPVLDLWAACLAALPDARLFLFNTSYTAKSMEYVRAQLAARGVSSDRLQIWQQTEHPNYFYEYHNVDIALDVFPWNGGTTVREALWMGVPTLALLGTRRSARATAAAMHRVGLADWIASSEADYVARLVQVTSSLGSLARLRSTLRDAMREDPL